MGSNSCILSVRSLTPVLGVKTPMNLFNDYIDLRPSNILMTFEHPSIIDEFNQNLPWHPMPRKIFDDRIVYLSNDDFGGSGRLTIHLRCSEYTRGLPTLMKRSEETDSSVTQFSLTTTDPLKFSWVWVGRPALICGTSLSW